MFARNMAAPACQLSSASTCLLVSSEKQSLMRAIMLIPVYPARQVMIMEMFARVMIILHIFFLLYIILSIICMLQQITLLNQCFWACCIYSRALRIAQTLVWYNSIIFTVALLGTAPTPQILDSSPDFRNEGLCSHNKEGRTDKSSPQAYIGPLSLVYAQFQAKP